MSDHFFVVTGGPGAGKTSLITELARRGFHTIPESGRAVIREDMQSGGDALPWADRMAYAERMGDPGSLRDCLEDTRPGTLQSRPRKQVAGLQLGRAESS